MRMNSFIIACLIILPPCNVAVAFGQDKPTVAIFDFELGSSESVRISISSDSGSESAKIQASRQTGLLSNKLITFFTQSNEVSVVEREKMREIMDEITLKDSGLVSPAEAREIGRLLGADFMIFGSISIYEGEVVYKDLPYDAGTQKIMSLVVGADTRLVNAETGQIVAAASLQAEDAVKEMNRGEKNYKLPQKFQNQVINNLAELIVDKLLTSINPVKVAQLSGSIVYLNRGNLKPNTQFTIVKLGEPILDPDNPKVVLGQEETPIAIIEVTSGMAKMSKAKVIKWLSDEHEVPKGSICRQIQKGDG